MSFSWEELFHLQQLLCNVVGYTDYLCVFCETTRMCHLYIICHILKNKAQEIIGPMISV